MCTMSSVCGFFFSNPLFFIRDVLYMGFKCCPLHYQISENNPEVNELTQSRSGQNLANAGPSDVMVGSITFVSSGMMPNNDASTCKHHCCKVQSLRAKHALCEAYSWGSSPKQSLKTGWRCIRTMREWTKSSLRLNESYALLARNYLAYLISWWYIPYSNVQ